MGNGVWQRILRCLLRARAISSSSSEVTHIRRLHFEHAATHLTFSVAPAQHHYKPSPRRGMFFIHPVVHNAAKCKFRPTGRYISTPGMACIFPDRPLSPSVVHNQCLCPTGMNPRNNPRTPAARNTPLPQHCITIYNAMAKLLLSQ